MVTMNDVQAQLQQLGVRPSIWAKPEINELHNILVPGEHITQLVTGWYNGGFALLCSTDCRVLLIDKKLLFLTLEDVRYDMIAEVMYQYRLLDASLTLTYAAKTLQFKSWNHSKLRQLASYVQLKVMEARQYDQQQQAQAQSLPFSKGTAAFSPQALVRQQAGSAFELPVQAIATLPRNPYQSKQPFRRRKISRFITSSQLAR
jgi:hypothetical protein